MKLLLGVSGSISAYKTYDLLRLLIKDDHEVRVVLTSGALEFVKAKVFHYLGAQKVYLPTDDFRADFHDPNVLHISLSKWADRIVIAPASANTMSKLAHGEAHDLLSSIFLANTLTPILFFPAMNSQIMEHFCFHKF